MEKEEFVEESSLLIKSFEESKSKVFNGRLELLLCLCVGSRVESFVIDSLFESRTDLI